jgi:HEAT repeat protein
VYLGLDTIDVAGPESGSDEFFLGVGDRKLCIRGGRADERTIRGKILPAMYEWMQRGRGPRFAEHGIFAVGRVSRGLHLPMAQVLWSNFLKLPYSEVSGAAATAQGIPGDPRALAPMRGLALDSEAGRELMQVHEVSTRTRACAALGLGLLGLADRESRADVSETLAGLLEERGADVEARASAALAFGNCPLPVGAETGLCYCGECAVGAPWTSLQAQVACLSGRVRDESEPELVRSSSVLALGALLDGRPEREIDELKTGVVRLLAHLCDSGSEQPDAVRESALIALGRIADADEDPADGWARACLKRRVVSGSEFEKRFALIALGRAGARPGSGEAWARAPEVRGHLLHFLGRGRNEQRPWAALALGVMGFWTRAHGGEPSEAVDIALERSLRRTRNEDLGAYALALGMRARGAASEILLEKLEKSKNDETRSYVALALGMLNASSAVEELHELCRSESAEPVLVERCGLALGLIGDRGVLELLHPMFEPEVREATRLGAVRAVRGIGSEDSVDALTRLLADPGASNELGNAAIAALGAIGDRAALPWSTAYSAWAHYAASPGCLTNGDGTGVIDYR